MNISSTSYTSSTAYLYQTTQDSSSSDSGSSDSIKSLFSSLSDALSSGDTSTATSLWSKLDTAFKAQSGQTDDSSGSTDDNNPLKKDMLKLKSYIEQGDTASATQTLNRIQKATSRGGPGGPPPPPADSARSGAKVSDLLSSIGSALTSGDTSTASDYLSQLDELLATKPKDSTSTSPSTSSSSSTEGSNPLKESIAQLQQYLQNGDTTSTASLFQDIQRAVNHNPWTPELGTEINSFA